MANFYLPHNLVSPAKVKIQVKKSYASILFSEVSAQPKFLKILHPGYLSRNLQIRRDAPKSVSAVRWNTNLEAN